MTLTMPKLSPTQESGTIVKWHKKEGDKIKEGDLLFEVATDKATVEYNAIDEGFLRKILVQEGVHAVINAPVAILTKTQDENIAGYTPGEVVSPPPREEIKTTAPKETKLSPSPPVTFAEPVFPPEPPLEKYTFPWPTEPQGRPATSPLAKRLAQERNIDLTSVKGSGPGGRIMSHDLDLSQPEAVVTFARTKMPTIPPGTYEEIPMSPMRQAIAKRLQGSKTFIPHFYVQHEVNAGKLVFLREELKASGIHVTYNDLIIRAAALALRTHPNINSGYFSGKILKFKTIDICVAVTVEGGLLTPIIRHADYKNLGQISEEIRLLVKRAKGGDLKPEEYKGGSFTISNLGMYGITDFQAVINPPQAAILAIGSILDRPIVQEGKVVPGKVLFLSLSSDHRVVDGADAAAFLVTIKKYLESPSVLLI